jgi:hypothetical protein
MLAITRAELRDGDRRAVRQAGSRDSASASGTLSGKQGFRHAECLTADAVGVLVGDRHLSVLLSRAITSMLAPPRR